MSYYERHLPHWQPNQAEFFVTFRLAGSLPVKAVKVLKSYQQKRNEEHDAGLEAKIRRKVFQKYEKLLDCSGSGPTWLKEEKVADIVQDALHFYDDKKYDLYAYCVMPNHVHLVF
jgi:hypothetical protein